MFLLIRYHRTASMHLTFAFGFECGLWSQWSDVNASVSWTINFSLFFCFVLNKCQGFRKSMDSIDCNFHTFENWLQSLFHVKSHWLFYMFVEKKKSEEKPFFFSCLIGSWQDNRLLLSLSILLIISIHENIEKPSSHPSLVYISHLFVSVHGILFLQ